MKNKGKKQFLFLLFGLPNLNLKYELVKEHKIKDTLQVILYTK